MRTLLTTVSAIVSSLCVAQLPYRPLPTADAEWTEYHSWTQGWDDTTCYRVISSGADTLIAGVLYHRLMTQGTCSHQSLLFGITSFTEPLTDLWYFREDSAARQVIVYDTTIQGEVILLDFSIASGAYPATYLSDYLELSVTGTDSLLLSDGWHNRIELSIETEIALAHLIEGVGVTAGFHLSPSGVAPPFPQYYNQLLCHSVNGVVIFTGGAGCNLSTSVPTTRSSSPELLMRPNPAEHEFSIIGMNGAGEQSFTVHDALGHLHFSGPLHGDRIACGTWPPGAYYITLYDGSLATRAGRLMKL